ncbi:unnamed protein product [Linum tenue]|uniref:Ribosomal protein/NADH dehydrogenase domain-containing protein n=1 Tax=Linum tenue TaxID=586396 RepID=A0AAV0IB13_9ROSI|nr:unnamed protein product [Linum tenue]
MPTALVPSSLACKQKYISYRPPQYQLLLLPIRILERALEIQLLLCHLWLEWAFIESHLPSFKEANPHLEVETELIRGQQPHLKAFYKQRAGGMQEEGGETEDRARDQTHCSEVSIHGE